MKFNLLLLSLIASAASAVHTNDRAIYATDIKTAAGTSIFKFPTAAPTAARACIYNADGEATSSTVTSTELGYVSGVTSAIQTQLGTKVSSLGTFGSTPNSSGASISGSTLTLQPASNLQPGGITTVTQSFSGQKTFNGAVISENYIEAPYFTANAAGAFNVSTFVPGTGGVGAISILSPTGYAGPVLQFKSNGTQVAYVTDIGDALFLSGNFQNGVYAGALGATGAAISLVNDIIPNNDNQWSLGDFSHALSSLYSHSGAFEAITLRGVPGPTIMLQLYEGSNDIGSWDSAGLLSTLYFRMNNNIGSAGNVLTVDNNGYGTWQAIPTPAAPAIGSVLDAGNDVGGRNIVNLGNTYPVSDNTYVNGQSGNRWATVETNGLVVDTIRPVSSTITLGNATTDTVKFVAGDAGGTPSNPGVCVKYFTVQDSSGGTFYICGEQ